MVRSLTQLIFSGNVSQAHSWFFKVKIPRSDRDAVFLPSHFSDILDTRKQIQIKSLAKVDAISLSIAETTPSSVRVYDFIQASNQIKRSTLDRWLQDASKPHIDWRQLVGDRACIYSELLAITNFLEYRTLCEWRLVDFDRLHPTKHLQPLRTPATSRRRWFECRQWFECRHRRDSCGRRQQWCGAGSSCSAGIESTRRILHRSACACERKCLVLDVRSRR